MKRVLILEDDKVVLEMMKDALEYCNYQVETAEKSEDALNLIDSYRPGVSGLYTRGNKRR